MKRILFAAGVLVCFAVAFVRGVDVNNQTPPGPPLFGGTYSPFTNLVTLLAPNVTNSAPRPIDVPSGHKLIIGATLIGATASVSNVVAFWNTSLDGINWTTDYAISNVFEVNGTTPHRKAYEIGSNFNGRFISLDKFSTPSLTNILFTNVNFTWIPVR